MHANPPVLRPTMLLKIMASRKLVLKPNKVNEKADPKQDNTKIFFLPYLSESHPKKILFEN